MQTIVTVASVLMMLPEGVVMTLASDKARSEMDLMGERKLGWFCH